jgi:membrane-bound lytic murein transglycosylase C
MQLNYLLLGIGLLGSAPLYGSDPFFDLDKEMAVYQQPSLQSQSLESEFKRYIRDQEKAYKNWLSQYLKEFDQFQNELVNKWGEGDVSQKQRSVEFSDDKNVKSVIDYENEQVTVALLVDKSLSEMDAKQAVRLKVDQLLADKKSNIARLFDDNQLVTTAHISMSDVRYSNKKKQQLKERIIEQTQAQAQEIDKQADRAQLPDSLLTERESRLLSTQAKKQLLASSKRRLSAANEQYDQARERAEQDKKIVLYTVTLAKNILAKRAAKYASFAERESQNFAVPAALVMAIMHSESAFDPLAKSAVPAYGLMQIVPTTAGHDVNKLLRNIDRPMDKKDLYIAAINIETGSAYLSILDKRYLRAITDKRSRLYCTIASYNTGAGNVARAFNENGSRNIRQAAIVINKLSATAVYERLMVKLPYDETKHYLQRVYSRIALYQTPS